jgi:F420-non-reducing hydrogenase small subunit
MSTKFKIAIYWAASCGGCEIAFINLHEKLLEVAEHFELAFCPCLLDTKKKDVLAWPDQYLDFTLFNGAIRTDENEEMAHVLRRKSKLLIAYGACAHLGGIPGLSNLYTREEHFQTVYLGNPSLDNPRGLRPQRETNVPEGTLRLPDFHAQVRTLAAVTEVDYVIPGCPPEAAQIWNVLDALIKGASLPARGSVLGAGRSSVCDECKRKRHADRKIIALRRAWEFVPNAEDCLLEQGLPCLGIATRDGCGGLCPNVNAPCAGCYGPSEGVADQAAKMAAAIGGLLDIEQLKGVPEDQIPGRVDAALRGLPDSAGTFLKFSVAGSTLGGRRSGDRA